MKFQVNHSLIAGSPSAVNNGNNKATWDDIEDLVLECSISTSLALHITFNHSVITTSEQISFRLCLLRVRSFENVFGGDLGVPKGGI